jgi:hypothetical protein
MALSKPVEPRSLRLQSTGVTDSRILRMLLTVEKKKTSITPEGEYQTQLQEVKEGKNSKLMLGFELDLNGQKQVVEKECIASLESGPLKKDLEIFNGSEFTRAQVEAGIDPAKFVGAKCRVIVMHKLKSGGKPAAVVSIILPPTNSN